MLVSQIILGGISFEPHVDQLVTGTFALADSNMMTQLYHYYWDVKNLLR
jgi:hypothetical protein